MGEAQVTREEARKLLGGYATGSLSDAERRLLFDAALEDQELFDELACEQALKELVEAPGARARLIAATESKRQSWWVWGSLAAATATGLVVWLTVVRPSESPKTEAVEVAAVGRPPEAPLVATAPPPPKAAEERQARRAEPKVEADATPLPEVAAEKSVAGEAAPQATAMAAVEPPKPVPAPPPAAPRAIEAAGKGKAAARADFGANDAGVGAGPALRVTGAPTNGPLSYEFLPNGNIRINTTAEGTLSVRAGERILYVPATIRPGVPVEVLIPVDVSTIRVALTDSPQSATIDVQVPR